MDIDVESAFKLFDIRGNYPKIVNERFAFALARALTQSRNPHKVLISCDTRESSPSLKEFLSDGFARCSVASYDLGESPMPMFNFAMTQGSYDLGVMITASHIADDENGFKIVLPGPLPLNESQVIEVKNAMLNYKDDAIVVPKIPTQKIAIMDAYIAQVLKLTGTDKPKIKIAIDATKSSVLTTIMSILQKLGADFHLVNSSRSGNPLLEINRRALQKDVVDTQSDLGIIWDSDGDRAVFIDRHGQLIPMSFVLGIFGAESIKNNKSKRVAVDIRAGLVVRDLVTQAGGELIILPAWNPYIKFAMKDDPTIAFGGETSGHFIFPDFYCIDDGILAALKFIRLFENGYIEEKLQQLGKKYFELPEKNIPCENEKSVTILEKLAEYYRGKNYLVSVVDGLTVFGENFKFNLRQSVTEPYLRLNVESPDQKTASEIEIQIGKFIN